MKTPVAGFYRVMLAGVGAAVISMQPLAFRASGEEVGTSQSHTVGFVGTFILHNHTGYTINYRVKWGKNGDWKDFSLSTDKQRTHKHPMVNGKAPGPLLSFDTDATGGKLFKTYDIDFGKVGSGGQTVGFVNDPMHYEFKASGGKTLLIKQ
jgi:hypothetical protein